MLIGFHGDLVSEELLEQAARDVRVASTSSRERPALHAWAEKASTLGPATSTRAMYEAAAVPLIVALGFESPSDVEAIDDAIVATIRAGEASVALVVTPWGARLDAHWRSAVVQAIRRAAPWGLLFN